MDVKLLWLPVVLLSSPLLTLCDPLFVLSAPNLLRVGSSENVFVEAQDYSGGNLNVRISVKNFPKKQEILFKTVILTADNYYQILTDIKIPDDQNFFSNDPLEKQYVYLQAQFPSHTLEKVVMVSFQSGYIFVQTDKPIYTPASTVFYRIFSLTPNMKPHSHSAITVEIMNPKGITVSAEKIYPVKGMQSGRYSISEVSSLGVWKVVTRYTNTPQKTFTADFEVKEYVPPTFEVILKLSKSFYFVDDQSLTVDIEAKYLFGEKVEGRAFVVFGVMDGEKKTSIPTSLQNVQIMKGEGTAELTREMITKTFRNINQLVGQSIYVSVSLLTESGSEMVEAERRGIPIVTSPYNIHFKKTPQFFKPGMPFSVSVYVTNPDQTPAENVEVEVNPGAVSGQTRANGIAKVIVNTVGGSSRLEITAKTKDPQLSDGQQAVKRMTALAYVPKGDSKNYLHISIDAAELEIGDQMLVSLNTGQSPGVKDQDYTYMILSKGQIVHANRFKGRGQPLVTLSLPVTKDMVPSFRFVAYYHVGSSEVVSDSVWVDVKDTCMGTLKLQVKEKMNTYGTGDEVILQITGDPGARVGLVVVNKATHVLNKNRLTQTKIWDVIEKHDTGCTAGGGRDSMEVFSDAGLMFESHSAGGTNTRTMPECPVLAKRRRRSDDEDDYYTDSDEIVSRTQFPESWLWEEIDLCENCPAPVADKVIYLKDSITTWQILAVSLSPTLGICVAEPEEIVISKQLFIDLKMPSSAVRSEQLEIKAIIHNYTPKKQKLRVEFMETEDVCSLASKKGKYRVIVNVDKDSSIAVSYVIIPMTLGDHMIEVKASAYDSVHTDGVRKTLKVVPEGVLIPMHRQNVELNPVKNGEKPIVVKAELPADRIPDAPAITYITITGEEISQNVERAISGDFMGRFIVQPSGNGEENMIYMTLPVIATHYLDSTNQWEAAGMDRRKEAINHISTGYQQQLSFRKSDGSYASGVNRPSSTWLTAYVAKVFTMANNFVAIERNVICSAIKWLVLNKQLQDGSFKEDSAVTHGEMVGDVRGKNADASMTAFVVIALQEGREICAGSVGSLDESIRKAVAFLEGRLPQLTNPYAVALTSYAMANADKLNKDILMKHSSQGEAGRSWTVTGQRYHTLEATAYAVLALVKAKDFDKAGEAVHWLAGQQSYYDGSGTTQATIMVFQAVAEYRPQVKDKQNFILEVELSVAGIRRPFRYTITRENMHIARSEKVEINKDFTVTAKGTGTAILSVLTLYYARPVEKKSDCTFFDLTVKMEQDSEVKQEGAIESYKFTMDFIYKSNKTDATMTILDIGIPTGFNVENKDLEKLSTGKERFIQKFEMDKRLSERGSLILYLDKFLHIEPQKISFIMHKMFDVGLLQPAAVTIYEYYSPDARCTKFYHPERADGALKRLCQGDLCYCAEENCSYQKNWVRWRDRLDEDCESDMDYVYKVTVLDVDLLLDSAIYDMKVQQVLKESTDDKKVEGKVRPFFAPISWRDHLELKQGESYLIKGKSTDLSRQGGSLKYILREQTCIKYCSTREESQIPEYRKQYISISALLNRPFKKISQPSTSQVSEEERLDRACEYVMDYVYKVTVMRMDLAQDSDIYHLKVDKVLKEGTDADAEEKVRPFLAHPRCREHMGLKQGKSYLIMGTVLQNLPHVQYMFGEWTWIEYWPTREEGQTRKYREQYISITALQDILLREGCSI
ncbi:complement C3-like [Megalobrama amblycephala]|uniref:complement C3-like n=1 Tax=Megalobrama amblycephala TaxID=75352 RepID=UPI0020147C04|nr:complement C3-like [Megalobrama amblycephala]